jgi:hypothetical protein
LISEHFGIFAFLVYKILFIKQSFHLCWDAHRNFWAKNENTRVSGKIYFILFGVYLTWISKIWSERNVLRIVSYILVQKYQRWLKNNGVTLCDKLKELFFPVFSTKIAAWRRAKKIRKRFHCILLLLFVGEFYSTWKTKVEYWFFNAKI